MSTAADIRDLLLMGGFWAIGIAACVYGLLLVRQAERETRGEP